MTGRHRVREVAHERGRVLAEAPVERTPRQPLHAVRPSPRWWQRVLAATGRGRR